ncbi:hypothetical protein D9M70_507260 [compost metagenome]
MIVTTSTCAYDQTAASLGSFATKNPRAVGLGLGLAVTQPWVVPWPARRRLNYEMTWLMVVTLLSPSAHERWLRPKQQASPSSHSLGNGLPRAGPIGRRSLPRKTWQRWSVMSFLCLESAITPRFCQWNGWIIYGKWRKRGSSSRQAAYAECAVISTT